MSPKLKASKGGRVEAGGSAFASSRSRVEFGAGGGADGGELSAGEAVVEALPGTRGQGVGARERGADFEPSEAKAITAASAGSAAEEVWRRGGGALWADVGGRAFGGGRRDRTGGRNAAGLDVGGGVVEPGPAAARASAAAGAEGAVWGVGAIGWQLSRLAGRAGAGRLPDEHGGRCDGDDALSAREGGDDLGGGGGAEGLDRVLRGAQGVVHGLEECVCAGAERRGTDAGRGAGDAVWAHVPGAGDRDLGGEFTPGERAGGEKSRDASGPFGEEAAAEKDWNARGRQSLLGRGVLPAAQRSLCAAGGGAGGRPLTEPRSEEAGEDLPAGNRTGAEP